MHQFYKQKHKQRPIMTVSADPLRLPLRLYVPLVPVFAQWGDQADVLNFPRDKFSALAQQFNGMINSQRSAGV